MKTIKISLILIVILAIVGGIFYGLQKITPPPAPKPPDNRFVARIYQKIDQLKAMPDNSFCHDFYKSIAGEIASFHKDRDFSKNTLDNDLWKENLEKTLFNAYADKFVKQSKNIFRGSDWRVQDLRLIQQIKSELNASKYFVSGSSVQSDFVMIQTVLNKHDEIMYFISSCNNLTYTNTELNYRFPVADVQIKIMRARSLLNNRMENSYVNNCSRLRNAVTSIPQQFFGKHVSYLNEKIRRWAPSSGSYKFYRDYRNEIFLSLQSEINSLDAPGYNVANESSKKSDLNIELNRFNSIAYRNLD